MHIDVAVVDLVLHLFRVELIEDGRLDHHVVEHPSISVREPNLHVVRPQRSLDHTLHLRQFHVHLQHTVAVGALGDALQQEALAVRRRVVADDHHTRELERPWRAVHTVGGTITG